MEENFERNVNDMCNLSQLVWEEGRAAGRSETQDDIRAAGFTEGHESGFTEGCENVAAQMLRASEPAEKIMLYTGLSLEKLKALAQNVDVPLAFA